MTSTPESWDDVGCLRLKVDSISQRVEDVHKGQHLQAASNDLTVLQLQAVTQELKAELAEQKKEACRMKVCVVITLVLFACVLAFQACTIHGEFSTGLTRQRMINNPEDLRGPQSRALVSTTLVSAEQANKDKKVRNDLQPKQNQVTQDDEKQLLGEESSLKMDDKTKQAMSGRKRWKEAQTAAKDENKKNKHLGEEMQKPSASWNMMEQQEPEAKRTPALEVLGSSIDSEGRPQIGAKSAQGDPLDGRESAKDAEDEDSEEGEDSEDGYQPTDEPRDKVMPFQIMKPETASELLKWSRHGVFWVCFPPNALEELVKKYTSVFNEVARSQKWRMYPFCYLDTSRLGFYTDHFCDDIKKITFVLEMNEAVDFGRKAEPPAWITSIFFKRTFQPDQEIKTSLIDQFLADIHSGALPEIQTFKGDL